MRDFIYEILSELHEINKEDVKNIIKKDTVVRKYTTVTKNGRPVIDKNTISKTQIIKLDYYKILINKYGTISFPNRSSVINELINIIPALHNFHRYTIYKFDIESFFYSVDALKSIKEIDRTLDLQYHEKNFLEKYAKEHKNLIPGLGIHNSMIEILGKKFDMRIREVFKENCIFYARYVDDGIIIFDEIFDEKFINKVVSNLLADTFGKRTRLNINKTKCYLCKDRVIKMEYLGYQFNKGQNNHFSFGIATSKLSKYKKKLESYIIDYRNTGDLNKLEFKLETFYKRIVFYGARKNDNFPRWQVRGLSDTYKELKRFMQGNDPYSKITKDTENLLKKEISIIFSRLKIDIPPSIKNKIDNDFYFANFKNNRAILLHPKLGWDYQKLKECLEKIHQKNTSNKSYSELSVIFFHIHR